LYNQKEERFFKHWWDEEIEIRENKTIDSFNLWKELGKKRHGTFYLNMLRDKSNYKNIIKQKRLSANKSVTDKLVNDLSKKNFKSFWATWKSKFHHGLSANMIDGFFDDIEIAENFATKFKMVNQPNCPVKHQELKDRFNASVISNIE